MEKRYTALRIIATVYKVLGVIIGIVVLLAAIGVCIIAATGGAAAGSAAQNAGPFAGLLTGVLGGVVVAIVTLLYGVPAAISLYGLGELVYLFINMEENTRATMLLLEQRNRQVPPAA